MLPAFSARTTQDESPAKWKVFAGPVRLTETSVAAEVASSSLFLRTLLQFVADVFTQVTVALYN